MNQKGVEKLGDKWLYLTMFVVAFALSSFLPAILAAIVASIFNSATPGAYQLFYDDIRNNDMIDYASTTIDIITIAQFAASAIVAVLIIVFLWRMLARDFKDFKKDLGYNILSIFLWFVVLFVLSTAVAIIFDMAGLKDTAENEVTVQRMLNSRFGFLMIISVLILAPFVEEMIYRKFLIGFFEKTLHIPLVISTVLAAVIFGLAHDTTIYVFQYLPLALAISMSYAYSKRNVWVSIGVHFLNNTLTLILTFAGI